MNPLTMTKMLSVCIVDTYGLIRMKGGLDAESVVYGHMARVPAKKMKMTKLHIFVLCAPKFIKVRF